MKGSFKMIKFDCKGFEEGRTQKWRGYISRLVYFGGHMEISIILSQPITADVCKTMSGFFVFFPHKEYGVNLGSLFNIDDNFGRLAEIFDYKDAYTIAYAIGKVGNLLSTPHKRRRVVSNSMIDEEELPF
jgi:hypothetical protein